MIKASKEDWEIYQNELSYGRWVREVGERMYSELFERFVLSKTFANRDNALLFSECASLLVGLPHHYAAFRGLTAYIARKAALHKMCFVVSPVIEFSYDTMVIHANDIEMALIPQEPKGR